MIVWEQSLASYLQPGDVIASVAASVAPSGLTPIDIEVSGQTVTLGLVAGAPGGDFQIRYLVACANGASYVIDVPIRFTMLIPRFGMPAPEDYGFGKPLVWPPVPLPPYLADPSGDPVVDNFDNYIASP